MEEDPRAGGGCIWKRKSSLSSIPLNLHFKRETNVETDPEEQSFSPKPCEVWSLRSARPQGGGLRRQASGGHIQEGLQDLPWARTIRFRVSHQGASCLLQLRKGRPHPAELPPVSDMQTRETCFKEMCQPSASCSRLRLGRLTRQEELSLQVQYQRDPGSGSASRPRWQAGSTSRRGLLTSRART